jgi:hypothetical protein
VRLRTTCSEEPNIGRIVTVRGPVKVNISYGLPCWLITPVQQTPSMMERRDGQAYPEILGCWSRADHPDAWLLPLTGLADDLCDQGSEDAGTDSQAEQPQIMAEPSGVPAMSMK